MKPQIHKWLALVAMRFSLVFVVTNASAKKGGNKLPPDPDPPMGTCETSVADFPAFMFWRNTTTSNNNPGYTIFLASEDGVCIRPLVDLPDSRNAWTWKFSFGYDQATEHGYVVWAKGGWGDDESEIWLQEFKVDGNTIDPPPDPELILITDLSDTDGLITIAADLDISADLQSLAFVFAQEAQPSETHVIDIATCRSSYPPCMPSEATLVLKESDGSFPNDRTGGWGRIAWGPLDKRIYLQIFRGEPLGVNQWGIHMIILTEGSWTGPGEKTIEDRELFTDDDYPEYAGVGRLGSFISDGEKLAFRHYGECRTISVIDVAACEAGPTESNPRPCEAEAQFFGTNPSWTDRGTIIHEIVERVKKHPRKEIYNCISSDFIGEWDPVNSEVTTLAEGEDPDAG
jgi:hypothetical protein